MRNLEIKNNDCHAALAMTKSVQSGRSRLPICKADAPLFLSDVYNKRYMSEKITSRCPQSGRSMIEMLGVLAIIGVLSVGGIAGYSKAMMKYRINKTIEQITLIAGNVRTFFNKGNYYSANCTCYTSNGCNGVSERDGCPIIRKAKILPEDMVTIDNSGKITDIVSKWGEKVYLYRANKAETNDFKAFSIGFKVSDLDICIALLAQDWTSSNISFIEIYGHNMSSGLKSPVSIDKAVELCEWGVIKYKNNQLVFYFDADPSGKYYQETIGWKN